MAVTLDQTNVAQAAFSAAGTGGSNFNTSATVAPGGMLVVLAGRFNSGTPGATLTMSGGGLTWAAGHNATSGNLRLYLFYAFAPSGLASGSTLTITNSAGTADITLAAASYAGVDSAAAPVAFNAASATATGWASGTVAAAAGNLLVGGAWEDGALLTSTPTGPAVERQDFNSATTTESVTLVDKIGVAGSDSLAGTWSSSVAHVGIGVAFAASAAAAPDAPPHTPLIFPLRLFGMMGPPLIAGFEGDAVTVTALSDSDTATGTDDGTVSATVPGSDAATGTDAGTVSATASGADTSTGTDAGTVSATASGSDSATGTDSGAASVTGTGGETGSGSDTGSIAATLSSSDSATGTDDGLVEDVTGGATVLTGSDEGTGTDDGTVVDLTPAPETGPTGPGYEEGGDESSIYGEPTRVLRDTDIGIGLETATLVDLTPKRRLELPLRVKRSRNLQGSDAALASDEGAVLVAASNADSGQLVKESSFVEVIDDPRGDAEDSEVLMMLNILDF